MAINKVYLTGKVCSEIKIKDNDGIPVANFTVSVPEGFGPNKRMNYFECNAWRKTAEYIKENAVSGTILTIEGHLRQHKWVHEGAKRSEVVVDIDNVVLGRTDEKQEAQ